MTETLSHAHTWVEIGIGVCGFGGIILSQWRNALGVKNEVKNVGGELRYVRDEVKRLADEAEKQNGRIRDLEITCARTHGVLPADRTKP